VRVFSPQMLNDRRVHALPICQDLMVPEPQNSIAFVSEKAAAFHIRRRQGVVLAAIDFDNQARFVTDKISNVASERHLTAESVTLHLARS
jgi:hypothetical protein